MQGIPVIPVRAQCLFWTLGLSCSLSVVCVEKVLKSYSGQSAH